MNHEELLADWVQNELEDAMERMLRAQGPIFYTDAGFAYVSAVVEEVVAKIDPEDWEEMRRRAEKFWR